MIKKEYDFVGNKKKFFTISVAVILVGIILSFILGVSLDISFTGGAIIKYSYTGELDKTVVQGAIKEVTGYDAKVEFSTSATTEEGDEGKRFTASFTADAANLDETTTDAIATSINEKNPGSNISRLSTNLVDPTMGREFLIKCLVAIVLAALFMVVYVALRFKKIGGWSAGFMAIVAILHDLAIVYIAFVVFGYPIDNNFVAVVLSIIGYSLNSTIVIFDRIRENRKLMGPKATYAELSNKSINQTLGRTVNSSFTTLMAVGSMTVVALVFGLDSIITFALPLMCGIVSGAYSSVFIASPLWVAWKERTTKNA